MGEYKIILSWFISYLKHNYFLYSEKISAIDIIQNWVFAHAYKQTTVGPSSNQTCTTFNNQWFFSTAHGGTFCRSVD